MTKVLAHRGFPKKYPENTMLSFKKAADFAIAGFETDVQRTKDGVLVLVHDEEISRVSNAKGWIKDLTLAELKTYDFRCGMNNYALDDDTRIPTLEEFFDWFAKTNFIVNLELKSSQVLYEGMTSETIEMVKKYKLTDRVIISSFNHRDVVLAKKNLPEMKCGFLTWSVILNPGQYTKKYGIDYYHPDYHTMYADDWKECRDLGIETNPYTIDDVADIKKMADEKVMHVITNDSETACGVLGLK